MINRNSLDKNVQKINNIIYSENKKRFKINNELKKNILLNNTGKVQKFYDVLNNPN